MINGMRRLTTEKDLLAIEKINRRIARRNRRVQMARKIGFPFHRLAKPREIVWTGGYGEKKYPACPRCGEYVYYEDMCCFCGQRFRNAQTVGSVMEKHER